MKNNFFISLILLGLIGSSNLLAKTKIEFDNLKNSVWTLTKNASQSRTWGDGQVLYFISGDAYNTYIARRDQEWNSFSIIDSRNLEYLVKGDQIKLLESKFRDRVLKVKLLSGIRKNKDYYIIADDLMKNFTQMEKTDEAG
tara:strand:- start:842 stop:1264 length:423 start_codon:yes stop_codon:yes gene_type:complete